MKKSLLIFGFALAVISCNKEAGSTAAAGLKTAYVDTNKIVQDLDEYKELDSQSKTKREVMAQELQAKAHQFDLDRASFPEEAKAKGMQWAQLRQQQLQKTGQELQMTQESMLQSLEQEFGPKQDSLVSKIKKHVKEYGKKNGYDYIYGSGDVVSIMYAKDNYDITAKITKELNDSYKGSAKKEETTKTETTKTEVKK
ncbi:OmpH family outer membrane protein [Flavobacterium sp. DG1-102-2]|uniref:OmpH family outer membrane protein n=1 Tax=Flavobacterium sp. DG1-102-2 TaxID=3081663 RepID=UPI002949C06D|nr:OmpH family outer membrane protein [Flavobacterium sp. DG1-102-2]MDV6167762.1 OmpH family outer membrane protein [Flavobacterium sp. DG1-102-2]